MNTIKKYSRGLVSTMLFIGLCQMANGQFSSSAADKIKPLTYKTHTAVDQLFIFYQKHESEYLGSLTAIGPDTGKFNYIWTKYDDLSDGFNIPLKSENNVRTSSLTGLNEGGYRVQISNGVTVDTSFVGWIMLDNFKVWTIKDELGQVPYGESGCIDDLNWVRVSGAVELDDSFFYFDLQTHDTLWIINDFDVEWTSDNPELIIPNRTNKRVIGGNYSEAPPIEDTWYILTATDSLGMSETDSIFYDTKFTKAEFTVEYWDKVKAKEDPIDAWADDLTTDWHHPDDNTGSLDAPLTVRFINKSINGYEFTWVMLDSTDETGINNKYYEATFDVDYLPEYTYYRADKFYYPYLVSISDESCRDTFSLEDGIEVTKSELSIPNVFTPNGDGNNDYFIFKHQSLKEFKITIADRFGRVVYKEKVDDIYEWEGWRGTVLNTNRSVPDGQYYYVIEGLGYDNTVFRDPNYIEKIRLDRKTGGTTAPPTQGSGDPVASSNIYTGWIYIFRGTGTF